MILFHYDRSGSRRIKVVLGILGIILALLSATSLAVEMSGKRHPQCPAPDHLAVEGMHKA